MAGNDMVGRARTGCGKTLAFVLPIVEKLATTAGPGGRRKFGRTPSVIVLLPTRELAKQVCFRCEARNPAPNRVEHCLRYKTCKCLRRIAFGFASLGPATQHSLGPATQHSVQYLSTSTYPPMPCLPAPPVSQPNFWGGILGALSSSRPCGVKLDDFPHRTRAPNALSPADSDARVTAPGARELRGSIVLISEPMSSQP